MSWRTIQLGDQPCDQDIIILDLFDRVNVNYVGTDLEFRQRLQHDPASTNLILILNRPVWTSDIIQTCQQHLCSRIQQFYIGINRYQVLGNDTNTVIKNTKNIGSDLVSFISKITTDCGFVVTKLGYHDQDQGRYFNFVQPLTWIYGHKTAN